MADIIQLRRDVAADWTSVNPTLAIGELGFETDTGKFKVGDGATAWTSLTYYTGSLDLDDLDNVTITANASGEILKWNGSAWINNTLAEAGIAAASHTHTVSDVTDLDADLATFSVPASTTISAFGATLVDDADAGTARTTLGVAIGTDVQAQGAVLDDFNTLGAASIDGEFIVATGAGTFAYESGATVRTSLGLVIGTDVQAYDADTLKADTADQLTAGYTETLDDDGTKSSGTYTPDPDTGNTKAIVNGGAFTLDPPTAASGEVIHMQVLVTNNASAGAVTTSNFSLVAGDAFTTTNGDDFLCYIDVINKGGTTFSTLNVRALQ